MKHKMKYLCFGIAALTAVTGTAAAADLGRPALGYYPPPPAPVYAPFWTGFYIGVNGGGGFGTSNWDSTGGRDVSGWLAGATAGYNYQ
jgi:outer membrane immunogenic protein